MKPFKPYSPHQTYLLPPSPKDWLPPDHLVHFIDEAVDQLDLSAIFRAYEGEDRGQHWTLSEFRRRHLPALGELFVQTVHLAQKAGLVKLGQVALDGTKIKAYASKHAAMSYARMQQEEQRLREAIERCFAEVEATDRDEDRRFGDRRGDELPEHLKTVEKRREAIRRAMRALEEEARQKAAAEQAKRRAEAEAKGRRYRSRRDPAQARPSPKAQRNFTDPDSRIMKDPDGRFIQGYNAQAVVDTESQIIVAADLTNQAADAPHLIPMADQVEANTGRRPGEWLADAGYFDTDAIQTLQARGLRVLIPADKLRHRDRRTTQPPPDPPAPGASLREWMRYWLKMPEVLARYRKREQSVEPVFGQIKEARRLRQFLLRGLAKVRALWRLDCAVHNLLKLDRAGVRFRRRPLAPDVARHEARGEEWALAGAL
ncbi:transposase [Geochorda subterranea]|uniref:Transposase n=1 Tax=Geochorda subterranea TaxID=3109564 RepID=A0ABZ1BQL4_9FIRM|nr:transposase [Limnochorda sp. LNt]WRP14407.1 transposase [Limnochorda sp. LNt]